VRILSDQHLHIALVTLARDDMLFQAKSPFKSIKETSKNSQRGVTAANFV
jgi:hypothetical protein